MLAGELADAGVDGGLVVAAAADQRQRGGDRAGGAGGRRGRRGGRPARAAAAGAGGRRGRGGAGAAAGRPRRGVAGGCGRARRAGSARLGVSAVGRLRLGSAASARPAASRRPLGGSAGSPRRITWVGLVPVGRRRSGSSSKMDRPWSLMRRAPPLCVGLRCRRSAQSVRWPGDEHTPARGRIARTGVCRCGRRLRRRGSG